MHSTLRVSILLILVCASARAAETGPPVSKIEPGPLKRLGEVANDTARKTGSGSLGDNSIYKARPKVDSKNKTLQELTEQARAAADELKGACTDAAGRAEKEALASEELASMKAEVETLVNSLTVDELKAIGDFRGRGNGPLYRKLYGRDGARVSSEANALASSTLAVSRYDQVLSVRPMKEPGFYFVLHYDPSNPGAKSKAKARVIGPLKGKDGTLLNGLSADEVLRHYGRIEANHLETKGRKPPNGIPQFYSLTRYYQEVVLNGPSCAPIGMPGVGLHFNLVSLAIHSERSGSESAKGPANGEAKPPTDGTGQAKPAE
jgi:hypothetical protein